MKNLFILLAILNFSTLYGQDRLFTYTYQSTVLNKGQKELEIWNTLSTGRKDYYSRLDNRSEFEIGLGGKLQTAFYLNITSQTSAIKAGSIINLETENTLSFSNEWKLKLMDPVANPIGLALYGEYRIGSNEYELEGKLILDKKLNNLTIASNAVFELELVPVPDINKTLWEKEKKFDLNLAFAYSVSPRFAITFENIYKNVFIGNSLEHSALYSGPGLSFSLTNFWLNFTALPQVKSFKGNTGSSLNLNEFEKVQFRLLFSYVF